MLLKDLYFIVPAALMSFLLSCWIIHSLYILRDKVSECELGRYSVLPGLGIVGSIAVTSFLWGGSYDYGISYLGGAIVISLLSYHKNGLIENNSLFRISTDVVAAIFLFAGLMTLSNEFGQFLISMEVVGSAIVIVLISYGFHYLTGIDDLVEGVLFIITSVLGILFWVAGDIGMSIFSIIIAAAIIGYLVSKTYLENFNLDARSWKLAGLFVGFLFVHFIFTGSSAVASKMSYLNSLSLILSLSIVPIFAFLAYAVGRYMRWDNFSIRKLPMIQYLLYLGVSDHQISFMLWMINILLVGVSFSTMSMGGYSQITLLILCAMLFVVSMQLLAIALLTQKFGHIKVRKIRKKLDWERS